MALKKHQDMIETLIEYSELNEQNNSRKLRVGR
jgi:hypothetical protein